MLQGAVETSTRSSVLLPASWVRPPRDGTMTGAGPPRLRRPGPGSQVALRAAVGGLRLLADAAMPGPTGTAEWIVRGLYFPSYPPIFLSIFTWFCLDVLVPPLLPAGCGDPYRVLRRSAGEGQSCFFSLALLGGSWSSLHLKRILTSSYGWGVSDFNTKGDKRVDLNPCSISAYEIFRF